MDPLTVEHREALQGRGCSNPSLHLKLRPPALHQQCLAAISSSVGTKWTDIKKRPLKLAVKFPERVPKWIYDGRQIDKKLILKWANEWGSDWDIFHSAKDDEIADITVKFYDEGPSDSGIGRYAAFGTPSMWLNLSETYAPGDNYKQYVVCHEFGHVLGLIHEHERSDFWTLVNEFFDEDKISRLNFNFPNGESYSDSTPFDPKSVMNYLWVNKAFLLPGYNSKEDLDGKELTDKQKQFLTEVIDITEEPVKPSAQDKRLINKIYGKTGAQGVSLEVHFSVEAGNLLYDDGTQANAMTYYQKVYLWCSSCNWERIEMLPNRLGTKYTAVLDLPPGRHEYKFQVDGKWCRHSDMPTTWNYCNTQNNVLNVTQKHIHAYDDMKNQTGFESHPLPAAFFT